MDKSEIGNPVNKIDRFTIIWYLNESPMNP